MKERFETPADIPELVPEVLWLPEDRPDLWVPHEEADTSATTTPREIGYAFYRGNFALGPAKQLLALCEMEEVDKESREFFEEDRWGNHEERACLRAMLDPNRLAPIDMVEVYEHELRIYSRFPEENERRFFENFIEFHGVLDERN
jgi:hypothetical protein